MERPYFLLNWTTAHKGCLKMAIYTEQAFKTEANTQWGRIENDLPIWNKLHPSKRKPGKDYDPDITAAIANGWSVYHNASSSTLKEMLLGDVKLRSELSILQNFGTTAGTQTMMARGLLKNGAVTITEDMVNASLIEQKTQYTAAIAEGVRLSKSTDSLVKPNEGSELLYKGSILNDGFWWPFINDAWVLGALHQLKIFHLTLASVEDDLLWDSAATRCRVLGRELIGLKTAGYSLVGLPAWVTTKPVVPARASGFSTASTTGAKATDAEVRAALGFTFAPNSKAKALNISLTSYLAEIDKYKSAAEIRTALFGSEVSYAAYDYRAIVES
ncbi:hypothetical protein NUH87_01105 [Pseudomonas batumici]|uniref:hypothetical protein n=1 Tax=Pseudomonas batumici TaxID=226910 RepID=UPI0030CEF8A5